MKRSVAAALVVLALFVTPVVYAAAKDLHVTGNVYVDGLVESTGIGISNFANVGAGQVTANRMTITNGGYGVDWRDDIGTSTTRIIAGSFGSPPSVTVPVSTLVLDRLSDGSAELWFKTGPAPTDWQRIAP